MVNTISMQDMRHLNLFAKITGVPTRFNFNYNDTIYFCVAKKDISKAVGDKGNNVRKLSQILNRKVKIIPKPKGIEEAKFFFESIVTPASFKELEVKEDEITITAGGVQSKATLMGRNKKRLTELQKISGNFFGKDLKIV